MENLQYILVRLPDGSDRCAFASNLPGEAETIAWRLARQFNTDCLVIDDRDYRVVARYNGRNGRDSSYRENPDLARQREHAICSGEKIIRYR